MGASDPVHLQSVGHSVVSRDKYAQCPTVQKIGVSPGAVLGRMSTLPLLCNDSVMVQTVQKTVLVPQLQFIDVGSIRCDHAAPSSNSFPYAVLSGFFALFLMAFFGLRPFFSGLFGEPSMAKSSSSPRAPGVAGSPGV